MRIKNMSRHFSHFQLTLIALILISAGVNIAYAQSIQEQSHLFSALRERLIADEISPGTVSKFFDDPGFALMPGVLRVNVRQPDAKAAYEGFVAQKSVDLTTNYLKKHRVIFDRVLSGSRVEAEIVVAILRVESSLGEYKGKYPIMNVFASLSLLDSENIGEIAPLFWDHVLKDSSPGEEPALRKKAKKRASSKARWAYKELKVLMKMAEDGKIDPLDVKGSWAGAFGLPQFLPSSMDAYAVDGNGDEKIDLYILDDAIASIANYLKIHGYRIDNAQKRRKAVWHYNHSDEYVDCIIRLADKVKTNL
ncbi:MAG: lytic murein transglycosylase [Candidatus Electryonea clarkiae]|nr:lytic murein transglycosylase [Candidatus Electryonea clarkiae]